MRTRETTVFKEKDRFTIALHQPRTGCGRRLDPGAGSLMPAGVTSPIQVRGYKPRLVI